ncbi:ParB/RepB/Spo0J family partition protein [Streptomyces sp. NBC_00510]
MSGEAPGVRTTVTEEESHHGHCDQGPKAAPPADDVTEKPDAATAPAEAFGTTWTLQDIDPSHLVRDEASARPDTPPDAALIASIKAIGVQEVVGVRPRPDGTFGVFKGWRRSQAAQLANDSAEAENRPPA